MKNLTACLLRDPRSPADNACFCVGSVLLVMNESGARGILAGKVKLGGDASVAAGPVGRDASAETDVTLRSEILSYSRARGLFAGISLAGQPFGLTIKQMSRFMAGSSRPSRSCSRAMWRFPWRLNN